MPETCRAANTIGRMITGVFQSPCPPPEDDKGRDYFRVFVELDRTHYLEIYGDLFSRSRPLALLSQVETHTLGLQRLEAVNTLVSGDVLSDVLTTNSGETIRRLLSSRLLWLSDEEEGTIVTVIEEREATLDYFDNLRPYFS